MRRAAVPLNTIGRIAQRLNQPVHRVAYVIRTRPHIAPAALAGRTRLFSEETLAQVRHELNAMDARGSASGGLD